MGKKLVDPNKLCMGCMDIVDDITKPCPRCGFVLSNYQRPVNSMPAYEILNGKYLVGRVIGVGGFGITYIGWDFYQSKRVCIKEYFPKGVAARDMTQTTMTATTSSTQYSMNVLTQNTHQALEAYRGGLQSYINEAKNLSRFYAMPGIVSVRDFFYGNSTAYIVMEYIEGTNLRQYAKSYGGKIPPDILLPMLKDVIIALNTVHKENIIHRDISPDNIMINTKFEVKVIDFGAAKEYHGARDNSILLKHGYAPIEQYDRNGDQGPWTDVYSLCASIYYLLSHIKLQKAYERVGEDLMRPLRALGISISEAQDAALQKGLSVQIQDRFQTMAEFYHALYGEYIPGEEPRLAVVKNNSTSKETMQSGSLSVAQEKASVKYQEENTNKKSASIAEMENALLENEAENKEIEIDELPPTEPEKSRDEAAMEYLREKLEASE